MLSVLHSCHFYITKKSTTKYYDYEKDFFTFCYDDGVVYFWLR